MAVNIDVILANVWTWVSVYEYNVSMDACMCESMFVCIMCI